MKSELSVVVPIYNEEKNISRTLEEIHSAMPTAEIIAVNDGSKDNSLEVLNSEKKKYPCLKVISYGANRGYGGALKAGFSSSNAKYVAFLDADLTYPPQAIPPMLELLKNRRLDWVWGNRFGGRRNSMPIVRQIGNKMLLSLNFIATFRDVKDCCSGERVFLRESLSKVDFETLPNGLDFISALTKRIVARKLRFATIPITYCKREGSSKLNIVKDFIRMSRNIIYEK
jgi:glycosyltransferase involved in cell wall biosynthesis